MNINITNRNDKVSPALREKIEAWLEESQKRYNVITSAQVTIEKSNGKEAVVEATVHATGKDLFAKASEENLFAALDSMAQKIDKQLAKIRDIQTNKKGASVPVMADTDDALTEEE
ncbi:ribosome-associated translation inhibitor RaiA [Amphritea sp. 1_MG-2023]|uniref:ribosome hibernation-promoting factor, HPF/YfiA family n=1 Tax=Amphritea sp. 1_MG-2023 TaxID=3062670 RepID=UPI0026E2104A|nr:ribosome-associated translation inhibitor RaiA [Amphritea sp. 1_MG-2023]MDO6562174.1 ribosome-associated translation inhibitor RaiA [Amphritea sp. 1_MG-2023]